MKSNFGMTLLVWAVFSGAILPGCAKVPSQPVTYHQPDAIITINVSQTFGCKEDKGTVYTALGIQSSTAYVASSEVVEFNLDTFGGTLKKPTFTIDRTADGRLSGINAVSEGQGAALIKSAVGIVASFIPGAGGATGTAFRGPVKSGPRAMSCADIRALAKDAKPTEPVAVTITYAAPVVVRQGGTVLPSPEAPAGAFDTAVGPLVMKADPASSAAAFALKDVLGQFRVDADAHFVSGEQDQGNGTATRAPVDCKAAPVADHILSLPLRTVTDAIVKVHYKAPVGPEIEAWQGRVTIPTAYCYAVLIPTGAAFGSSEVTLKLGNAGNLEQLKYGVTATGSGDTLAALAAIAGARPTDASRAKALDDQTDLIAAQEKLVKCKADRDSCTK